MQHLVRTQQFTKASLRDLFALADTLEKKRDNSLEGKILASLFYEPSTRTRFSFESAMMRLGGNVLSMENAREASSDAKGESLEDTIRVVNYYADIIVLRHPEAGASERASKVSKVPVINAGDGAGQHPTQALLDLYTIQREHGKPDGISIAFVGDLKYGRAARSLAYLLGKFDDVKITFVSEPELRAGDDLKAYLKRHDVSFEETDDMKSAMKTADVIYQTRIQKERFANEADYKRLKGHYIIDGAAAASMKKGAIIIHPLPRVGEITEEVDASPHAVYFKQVGYGHSVRMALLQTMLNGKKA